MDSRVLVLPCSTKVSLSTPETLFASAIATITVSDQLVQCAHYGANLCDNTRAVLPIAMDPSSASSPAAMTSLPFGPTLTTVFTTADPPTFTLTPSASIAMTMSVLTSTPAASTSMLPNPTSEDEDSTGDDDEGGVHPTQGSVVVYITMGVFIAFGIACGLVTNQTVVIWFMKQVERAKAAYAPPSTARTASELT
ncbi:hypothetical protein PV10_03202 [Exophiala mesophila]|uniref:Uncharacterized protein n=1 Tax=Exophiala mesophila TaxID=212818 RepID=A0A0D1X1E8_EXOME|nr:uncharacterized protein PV10_03202 [Exophiala mesophila]KIV95565.1 hypothetical protein PV10_03202 [Exophiala mesophila]